MRHLDLMRTAFFSITTVFTFLALFWQSEDLVSFHFSTNHTLDRKSYQSISSVASLVRNASQNLRLDRMHPSDLESARNLYHKVRPANRKSCTTYEPEPLSENHMENLENSRKLTKIEVERLRGKPFLEKTVFRGQPKVILFAGLEGTGHHFVAMGFQALLEDRNYSTVFRGYEGLLQCKTHWKVFRNNSMLESFKKSLLNFPSKVLFLNSVSGKFSDQF